jgi:hypothetical protein
MTSDRLHGKNADICNENWSLILLDSARKRRMEQEMLAKISISASCPALMVCCQFVKFAFFVVHREAFTSQARVPATQISFASFSHLAVLQSLRISLYWKQGSIYT